MQRDQQNVNDENRKDTNVPSSSGDKVTPDPIGSSSLGELFALD
jgi:hypothetical protein